jgi:hypothetical protein
MFNFCAANAKTQQLWPAWKIRLLALIAWTIRIQFKIDGYPYGGPMSKRQIVRTGNASSAGAQLGE